MHQRGLNLLGLKSANFELAAKLRAAIQDQRLPMDIVLCPEAYPHRARQIGGALLHHIANPVLDPSWDGAQREIWRQADAVGAEGLPWQAYNQQAVRPLQQIGSLVYPEQDFEMEFAYQAYGDTYNAFLAGFNWAPSDFVRVFPWRERYADKLPPIADADAHGNLAKWSAQLDHTRNLYLAAEPSYEAFQDAAKNGRLICVIRGREGEASAYYGPANAVLYAKERIDGWKWW